MSEVKRPLESMTPMKNDDMIQSASKNAPALRQGDWICVSCNNLNFSFRTICNRCKTQTRQTNFFNFLLPGQVVAGVSCYTLTDTKKNPQTQSVNEDKYWPTESKAKQTNNTSKSVKVFQNALLLTPTKDQEKNPSSDEPYKSPFRLPSVSPLLKKFTESHVIERYSTNHESNHKEMYAKSHAKLIDFGRYHSHEITEDQDGDLFEDEIDRLLESIEL